MRVVHRQAVTGEGVAEIGSFPTQAAKHQVGALESASARRAFLRSMPTSQSRTPVSNPLQVAPSRQMDWRWQRSRLATVRAADLQENPVVNTQS
jgi:hypothetical protein